MFPRIGRRRNSKNDGDGKNEIKEKHRGLFSRNKSSVEELHNPERRQSSQEQERRRSSEASMLSEVNSSLSSFTSSDADNNGANDGGPLMVQSVLSGLAKTKEMPALHEMVSASSSESLKTATPRGSFKPRRPSSTAGSQSRRPSSASGSQSRRPSSTTGSKSPRPLPTAGIAFRGEGLVLTAMRRFRRPLAVKQNNFFPARISMPTRRALEIELMQHMDRLVINKHVGEFWFLMDAVWTNKWVQFVMGTADPPGEITNSNLFVKEGQNQARRSSRLEGQAAPDEPTASTSFSRNDRGLVQGLKKITDYRAVHPMVWYTFCEIYDKDGAPDICRWSANLYSEPVQPCRRRRVEDDAHTKAAYQLRAFLDRADKGSASIANMP